MKEDCKKRLQHDLRHYAALPPDPDFLEVIPVPNFWLSLLGGLGTSLIWLVGSVIGSVVVLILCKIYWYFYDLFSHGWFIDQALWTRRIALVLAIIIVGGIFFFSLISVVPHFVVKRANGKKPAENQRRKKEYEEAVEGALRKAEPIKAEKDYQLNIQIRELEGKMRKVEFEIENVMKQRHKASK